ncbi:hypothetical protein [Enterobacter cloacae]|uniref:hypothetical protein n=1 Tax=Enterobacter cloacae TaxID=550 RepID=UPI001E37A157|nr:hypothetical protein [Enterobacter cloacae]
MFASKPAKAYVFSLANPQPQNASSPDMETYPELMMQQVQSLSLILTREANELTQAQCDVMLNGESTGILVPGHILEAAVQVNDQRYILFLTDDIIFEESLRPLLRRKT